MVKNNLNHTKYFSWWEMYTFTIKLFQTQKTTQFLPKSFLKLSRDCKSRFGCFKDDRGICVCTRTPQIVVIIYCFKWRLYVSCGGCWALVSASRLVWNLVSPQYCSVKSDYLIVSFPFGLSRKRGSVGLAKKKKRTNTGKEICNGRVSISPRPLK